MKHLPIGIQTFEKIIRENYLYVDKTAYVYELTKTGTFYFFSRPRRFGKSLLLSTLKSFFEGREDLFRGLYIHDQVKEWKKYPVLHLDYSFVEYKRGIDVFEKSLLAYLKSISRSLKVEVEGEVVKNFFRDLVLALYEKYGPVVILVDEYDKPLVDTLLDEKSFEENRGVLNGLYGSMKGMDAQLRFVFLTGVSRFAKVGIFSGMNNPDDVSLEEQFSQMVGFTQQELEKYFQPHLEELRQKLKLPAQELMNYIRLWYNGFSWDGQNHLYNPFSILNFLKKKDFDNYWFSTGTPTFLIELLKKQKQLPEKLERIIVSDLIGSSIKFQNLPLQPLMFQTGYLTIEKIIRDGVQVYYQLNYPNREVRHSFLTFILASFVKKDEYSIQPEALYLKRALLDEDTERFLTRLQSFFAEIPARLHLPREAYYHSLVYLLLRLTGLRMTLEKETDKGRIDAVMEFPDKVYIIEFKFATDKRTKNVKTLVNQALKQIENKKYYETWLGRDKKIILFGIGFLNKTIDGRAKFIGV